MNAAYVVATLGVVGLLTFGLRALPFFAAQWLRKHAFVARLGRFLPLAIMVLLVLHTVMGAAQSHAKAELQGPWFELLSMAVVCLLQWRVRNPLLSILAGALLYMVLRNTPALQG